jgi:hypothetical protein
MAPRQTSGIVKGMTTLIVARRFCGPAASANGGYFAGLVAGLASHTLAVRLLRPPPLETELTVLELPEGGIEVRDGELLVSEAAPARLDLSVPQAPSYLDAVEASRHYAGFSSHRFPTCCVCGPQRTRGDGMRIFAGPLAQRELVAAPWVPDASLDRGDGKVRPEFMSAALDCPGYFSLCSDDRMMLLGQLTAHIDRRVHVGESCIAVGWKIGTSGRKHEAGTAIFDGDGELCGRARAVWIEPRTTVTLAAPQSASPPQ